MLLLCLTKTAQAQDVHFSQYYFSPLSLNPANTGNYKGDYRLFANYRSQWRTLDNGFNTYSVGGDINYFPKNINISPGILILNDQSAKYLKVTKIFPSFALHHKLAGFKLHLGIQPGVVIKSIDFYKHSFPNQLNWNTGAFDNSLPNIETNVGQRFTFFDLNMGFGASRRLGKFEPEIGLAFFHLNKPKESFLDNTNNTLPIRQAYNVSINYSVTPIIILNFHSLYGATTKASDLVSGLNLEFVLSRGPFFDNSVFAGFMWRNGFDRNVDAGVITAGLKYLRVILNPSLVAASGLFLYQAASL